MNQAGLYAPCIAYNEHRIAPALSALGSKLGAADEARKNRNAARARRAKALPPGPVQPAPALRRPRGHIRALYRAGRRAAKRGDVSTLKSITLELNELLRARANRKVQP